MGETSGSRGSGRYTVSWWEIWEHPVGEVGASSQWEWEALRVRGTVQ